MPDPAPSTITVEIDPERELPERYLGSNEDGPIYGSITLIDAIVGAAAERLVGKVEEKLTEKVGFAVDEKIGLLLEERLPQIIDDVLGGDITVTDNWGAEKSHGTLREAIVKHAQQELTIREGRSLGMNETVLSKTIKEEIDRRLGSELSAAVKEAKELVTGKVREVAAEQLADAITRGVTSR